MSFVVAATYVSRPGAEEELAGHLAAMLAPSNAEPDCETYRVIASRDDPRTFLIFEVYVDEDAFQAHSASDHFEAHIRNGAWDLIDSRTVIFGEDLLA